MTSYHFINLQIISDYMLNNSAMKIEFVSLYLAQTPKDVAALEAAIIANDYQQTANKAHYIKPTMEYIGAYTLKDRIVKIEDLAKKKAHFDVIKAVFETLATECEQVYAELRQYLDTLELETVS